jgi:hypothetical protein
MMRAFSMCERATHGLLVVGAGGCVPRASPAVPRFTSAVAVDRFGYLFQFTVTQFQSTVSVHRSFNSSSQHDRVFKSCDWVCVERTLRDDARARLDELAPRSCAISGAASLPPAVPLRGVL